MYREQWLHQGLVLLTNKVFVPAKYKPPTDIKVSCGFPSSGAFNPRRQTIGQCWYPQQATDHQLFISPTLDLPVRVLDVMVHEVVHTLAGKQAAHGKEFKYVATRVGLTGKMTATVAGPELESKLCSIAKELGPYPHKAITGQLKMKVPKLKSVKCECEYGYVARVSEEWIVEAGPPVCPACKIPMEIN